MIVSIDVHYRERFAKVVSIEFDHWTDEYPKRTNELLISEVQNYVPGSFYKRELPCILKILECSPRDEIELILVDGYVFLDDHQKAGLGKYLFDALNAKIPVVGVAKKAFRDNELNVVKVYRGKSVNPLYVTCVGINLKVAAERVQHMAGNYRMPDLLRILDRKTKE